MQYLSKQIQIQPKSSDHQFIKAIIGYLTSGKIASVFVILYSKVEL